MQPKKVVVAMYFRYFLIATNTICNYIFINLLIHFIAFNQTFL